MSVVKPRETTPYVGPILFILAVGLCAHGLLAFTDYILWDGYWYHAELAALGGPQGMLRLFSEIGRPLDYLYLLPFEIFHGPVPPKVAGILAWVLVPALMFYVLEFGAGFPRGFALAVAIVASALPVFDVLGEIALLMNTLAVLFFWCGFALLIKFNELSALRGWTGKAVALLLILFSFNLNSLLVFFYALGLFVFCSRYVFQGGGASMRSLVLTALRKHWVFAVAPLGFWMAKSLLTPVNGYYVGYNQPVFSLGRMLSGALSVGQFLLGEASECVSSGWIIVPALIAATVAAVGLGGSSAFRAGSEREGRPIVVGVVAAGGGIVLLMAAAFSYAVVDQALSSFGWLSRNCILTGLPIALLICGLCFVLNELFARHRPKAWLVPVAAVVVMSIAVSNRNYLQFQALGAKQDSVAAKLKLAIASDDCNVVQLRDYFIIPDTIYYYAPIVWTYIAATESSHPKTFVFDIAQMLPPQETINALGERQVMFPAVQVRSEGLGQMLEQTTMPYMLESIPRTGPQIMFIVQQGKLGNDGVSLGARYLWLKWFNPDGLPEFLDQVTETHVIELSSVTSA